MTILIDNRAGSKDLIDHPPLSTLGQLTRLAHGDAYFSGNGPHGPTLVGIELKSINDLLSSIQSKRLQGAQLPGMAEEYDISYILYYGYRRSCPKTGNLQILRRKYKSKGRWKWTLAGSDDLGRKNLVWTYANLGGQRRIPFSYLQGFLFSSEEARIRYDIVGDVEEAARWIGALYHWRQKKWSEHRSFRCLYDLTLPREIPKDPSNPFSPKLSDSQTQAAKTALVVNGLGQELAIRAGLHFGSSSAVVAASVEDWMEVKGIGKVLAKAAHEWFHGSCARH